MLRSRKINDCIADLHEAMKVSADARIEKYARTILDFELANQKLPKNSDRDEVPKVTLAITSTALAQVLLKQGRYADAKEVLEWTKTSWHDIAVNTSDEKQMAVVNFAVLVNDAKAAKKNGKADSAELQALLKLVNEIESCAQAAPAKNAANATTSPGAEPNRSPAESLKKDDAAAEPESISSTPEAPAIPPANGREEKTSTPDPLKKGLEFLNEAKRIKSEAEQMIQDLIKPGLTWGEATNIGENTELDAAYAAFARCPRLHPTIAAKFEEAVVLYRKGLGYLAHAPGYDNGTTNLATWCGGLAGLLKTAGRFEEAAEVEKQMSALPSPYQSDDKTSDDKKREQADGPIGQELHTLNQGKPVRCLAFSPNGKILASGGDKTIRLWDVATGKELYSLVLNARTTEVINCLAFSSNGKLLASGSSTGNIKFWETATGTRLGIWAGHSTEIADDSDFENYLKKPFMERFSIASRNRIISHALVSINAIAFSPCGHIFATGSNDKTIKVWNVNSGKELHTLTGHTDAVSSLAFGRDAKLVSGSNDGTVKLWNADKGEELNHLGGHTYFAGVYHRVNSVAFGHDCLDVFSGSADNTVKRWTTLGSLDGTFNGHKGDVNSVSCSPDNIILGSGSKDKTVKIWYLPGAIDSVYLEKHCKNYLRIRGRLGEKTDAANFDLKKELKTLKSHTAEVTSVVFSKDGKVLASASRDGIIKLWSWTKFEHFYD